MLGWKATLDRPYLKTLLVSGSMCISLTLSASRATLARVYLNRSFTHLFLDFS